MTKKDDPKKRKNQDSHLPPPVIVPGFLNKLVDLSSKIIKKVFK